MDWTGVVCITCELLFCFYRVGYLCNRYVLEPNQNETDITCVYNCNGATETRDVRIHTHSFIERHGQSTGRVEHQQTGVAQTRHKSNPKTGMGWSTANLILRARRTWNPQTEDSPGEVQTQSETARQRVNPRQAISYRAGRDQTGRGKPG